MDNFKGLTSRTRIKNNGPRLCSAEVAGIAVINSEGNCCVSISRSRAVGFESSAYSNSTWIVETLLKNYDRRIRPGVKGELIFSRVHIDITLSLAHVNSLIKYIN